jgi:hypothetical protein
VQTQFHRFREEVTPAYGIDDEAVNLSGLDDEPSQYFTLMLNMAEEIATKKQESADKRERKEKLIKQMVNFE